MKQETYNGWTNRETWLVNLYFGYVMDTNIQEWLYNEENNENEKPTRQEIADYYKDCFEAYMEGTERDIQNLKFGGFLWDFIDFGKIDFYDLAEQFVEEE